MTVPNSFANATTAIPLSQLDQNFNTPITLGNTAILLGNTVTTLNNMTLANVTVSSVSAPVTVAQGGTGLSTTPANGELLIGNGTGYTKATLTAGSNISITNGSGSISIASTATQTYPGAGIAVSTGSAWTTSLTAPSGTIVGTTDTQTLSAKTLQTPNITSGLTLTGSAGTSGQALLSQGTGNAPIWGAPTSLTLLATITPANGVSTASATGLASSTEIIIAVSGITVAANSGLRFALSSDNGSNYGTAVTFTATNGTSPSGVAFIFRTATSSANKPYGSLGSGSTSGNYTTTTGIINAVQISLSAATTFTGTGDIFVYGVN